jgi:hypothetical protein
MSPVQCDFQFQEQGRAKRDQIKWLRHLSISVYIYCLVRNAKNNVLCWKAQWHRAESTSLASRISSKAPKLRYNRQAMMTGRNPRRDIPKSTYKNSNKRSTMRDNLIYCIRSFILCIILLGILPHTIITNNWARINLTTHRNSTI